VHYVKALVAAGILATLPVTSPQPGVADAPPCDINGDGYGDLVVGAPGTPQDGRPRAGEATVFFGAASGLEQASSFVLRPGSGSMPGRARAQAEFGSAVACGDISGDGLADMVLAAPGEKVASDEEAGAVYLVLGSADPAAYSASRVTAASPGVPGRSRRGARFGAAVALGDLTGDGVGDIVLGVPGKGRIVLLPGAASGWAGTGATARRDARLGDLGSSLAVGDIDGDGQNDLAAGAPGSAMSSKPGAGLIALWMGGDLAVAPQLVSHSTPGVSGIARRNAALGHSLAAGDIDGDGYDDIVAGSPGYRVAGVKQAGEVLVVFGSSGGMSRRDTRHNLGGFGLQPERRDRFGWAVAVADLTGDGSGELVVGTPRRADLVPDEGLVTAIDRGGGAVHASLTSIEMSARAGAGLGSSIWAGDFNGNGRADLALGIPGSGHDPLRSGTVALTYGRSHIHLDPPSARPRRLVGFSRGGEFGVVSNTGLPADAPLMAVPLLDRAAWGARAPLTGLMERHHIDRLTIHHAGSHRAGTGPPIYRGWQDWHMNGRGWGDIAYHIIIGADGSVYAARQRKYAGDTGTSYDTAGHLLVVVEGNFDVDQPTEAQLGMLPKVVAWAADRYNLDLDEVLGHRDHAATSCPGDHLYPYIAGGDLAADVAELLELGKVIIDR